MSCASLIRFIRLAQDVEALKEANVSILDGRSFRLKLAVLCSLTCEALLYVLYFVLRFHDLFSETEF